MHIRRCTHLLIEPRERFVFALESLLEGGAGLRSEREWLALAPHLDAPAPLDVRDIPLLGALSAQEWIDREEIAQRDDAERLDALIANGLVISDAPGHADLRARDEALRDAHWHPYAAAQHAFGRWQGVSSGENVRGIGIQSVHDLIDTLGEPPPHLHERSDATRRVALPDAAPTSLDTLLRERTTCRNYDTSRALPLSTFSRIMKRVFGAQALHAVTPTAAIVKKTSPSAGGLHPTEAYLLLQHVEGTVPGLYHYHVGAHALERVEELSPDRARALALSFLAQQDWFADAHAIVIFAPRFPRSFWKYRNHAKVYRAVTLDVGHLSQTLQISATEFGLGAFVTAAINEVDIEQAFGFEAMRESPLAVGGFGWRAPNAERMEFDPLHAVWPEKS